MTDSPSPKRVACLLPSATETLAYIGGFHLLVARSHECDYPPSDTPVLTGATNAFESSRQMHEAVTQGMEETHGNGLYTINAELLRSLEPDVILTQSLCSVCSIDANVVARIVRDMPPPRPVVVSMNPYSLEEVIADCITVGEAVGLPEEGRAAAAALTARLNTAVLLVKKLGAPKFGKVAFLEWTDPLFPGGHWTPQLIHMAGGTHPLNPPSLPNGAALPSAELPVQAVVDCDPDWIILCPCGLDIETAIKESQGICKAPWWLSLRAVKEGRVAVVDGNQMFNRPGPRLLDALEWLVGLLHERPDVIPHDFPWQFWQQPLVVEEEGSKASIQYINKENGGCNPDLQKLSIVNGGSHDTAVEGDDNTCDLDAHPGSGQGCVLLSAAPNLSVDIESAHEVACSAGSGFYMDPSTGYRVFSSLGLLERGSCCGNRCRHCPYAHMRVASHRGQRVNVPPCPVLLDSKLLEQYCSKMSKLESCSDCISRSGGGDQSESTYVAAVLIPWDGKVLPMAVIQRVQQCDQVPVLVLAFERTRECNAQEGVTTWRRRVSIASEVIQESQESKCTAPLDYAFQQYKISGLGLPLILVPLMNGSVVGQQLTAWGRAERNSRRCKQRVVHVGDEWGSLKPVLSAALDTVENSPGPGGVPLRVMGIAYETENGIHQVTDCMSPCNASCTGDLPGLSWTEGTVLPFNFL
ncbi:hypothetical protein CEUSTIGMA_g5061.t1 [Chlamydomonas eustigma]|uniref:Fe/B12 periplasmic-binding domain-containing protein n=1 Tax=Chlamydomonas eustigma TaxID=1157962 RepID=A0A250X3G8_9CHLO|nr:hypothetical protein CEUSTIGMA_g5061.t1 [Chlamydomonas eustigma]|eukprot:GAX77617.1 hypothetical protein CEUSTIGMA_g5061.t1 [Chlamydomonas eustigma]